MRTVAGPRRWGLLILACLAGAGVLVATRLGGAEGALLHPLSDRLPLATAGTLAAPILSGLLGLGGGLLAARRSGWVDPRLRSLVGAGIGVCLAWLALVLVFWFAVQAELMPVLEDGPTARAGASALSSVLLPATVIVLGAATAITVSVRAATRVAAIEGHVQTARSRGLPTTAPVILRVFRRTMPTILAILLVEFLVLYASALTVQAVFTTPALATMLPLLPADSLPFVLGACLSCVVGVIMTGVTVASAALGPAAPRPPQTGPTPGGLAAALLADSRQARPALPSTMFRSTDLLDIRDLCLHDRAAQEPRDTLHGISLTATRGQALAVVGGGSDATSSLCHAIAGLLPLDSPIRSGSILFDGTELVGLAEAEFRHLRGQQIGFLPAPAADRLDPDVRIGHQLAGILAGRPGHSRSDARSGAAALLTAVGVDNVEAVLWAFPHQVSALISQRVLLAGALVREPQLLVADNPTEGLDTADEESFLDSLHALQKQLGFTLIVASPRAEIIARCDRVAVMSDDTIVEHASVPELLIDPRHPHSRRLLADRSSGPRPIGR
ncbi:ABC-type dipeptide/oligopeptide/nickel transport system ATPase component/ABC-type antimicrobial peptide transport system permease subunit [Cryobacterium sp. MP_3.1]|uniref:ATP-binding cassette domain-containing protein n=1 Tax=Cryobacterium sp. MP_3.1 TaxID=3071711 RepID=UPI002DFD73BF|nr:ABC-type dipeptide/oligopeptide/nickel transport system ATPase component/ABC-type antimicrobial peptide transport system permease subunit [Cryobacterium sp. MP_3.1]